MRIRTFDEFPEGWEAQSVLLMHQGFGSSWDPRTLSQYRKGPRYPRLADYVGLGAFEGDRLVASVEVVRFPFRTREGETTCSGIAAVVTAPDRSHRGYARALLQEAHRREREFGSPFALLYTGKTGRAHTLYESLGYRDVWEFPRATRAVPRIRRRLPRGYSWRRARPSDRGDMVRVHEEAVALACGFTRKDVPWWPPSSGYSPEGGWGILRREGRTVGYGRSVPAYAVRNCREAVVARAEDAGALVAALEAEAKGKWIVFIGGPFLRFRELLRHRGYRESPSSYGVLMGCSLTSSLTAKDVRRAVGADNADFACGELDSF